MGSRDDRGRDSDGYDAQSEDDSHEEGPPRRHKRFTARSRPRPLAVDTAHLSSMPGSSSHSSTGYGSNVERSDSGHALFYNPALKVWRREETGLRKRHKDTERLEPEQLTASVTNLHRTHSGTPVVYDRWRGYWRRERRHKTVNFDALTAEQQQARRTASGTDLYYDERRLEWRRQRAHPSDVAAPSGAQQLLKRSGSGSAIVFDDTRQAWKRKRKRMGPLGPRHVSEAERETARRWDRLLVHTNQGWFLEKNRKHLQDGELSKRQIKAHRTGSGTPIVYDDVHRRWKRMSAEEGGASTSGASRAGGINRRHHRHHHGFKRISYVYTKNKITGKWSKKKMAEPDYLRKRLRTPDGGYIYFDNERVCWRKAKAETAQEHRSSFMERMQEFFFGEDDESLPDDQSNPRTTGHSSQLGAGPYDESQRDSHQHESYRPGLWGRLKRFFLSLCRCLRIC